MEDADIREGGAAMGFWLSLVAGVLGVVGMAYLLLAFGGRGLVSRHVKGGGFSSSRTGYSTGWEYCNLSAGQMVRVDYDMRDHRSGYLVVYLWSSEFFKLPQIVDSRKVERVGSGRIEFRPAKPGRYRISFEPQPDGRGYDFGYRAEWWVE